MIQYNQMGGGPTQLFLILFLAVHVAESPLYKDMLS